ncbi:hypothetical protein AB837_00616 [bacterium AB1]|nr:hypothetical protein AB837_00616 [bacterium AB1]
MPSLNFIISANDYKALQNLFKSCFQKNRMIRSDEIFEASNHQNYTVLNESYKLETHSENYVPLIDEQQLSTIECETVKQCIKYVIDRSESDIVILNCLAFLLSICEKNTLEKTSNRLVSFRQNIYKQLTEFEKAPVKLQPDEMYTLQHFFIDVFSILLYMKDPKFVLQAENYEFVKKYKREGYTSRIANDLKDCTRLDHAIDFQRNTRLKKYIKYNRCHHIGNIISLFVFANRKTYNKEYAFKDLKHWFVYDYLRYSVVASKHNDDLIRAYSSFSINVQSLSSLPNETFDKLIDLFYYYLTHDKDEDYVKTIFHKISCFRAEDFEIQPIPKSRSLVLQ